MPKYRQLHTKIIDSFDFNEMPNDFIRVFWMLLIVTADSQGRMIDNPVWVRSKMFPMRDNVKSSEITSAIDWLANRKMIVRYEVDNKGYFYIPSFQSHQTGTSKEAQSLLPAPPEPVNSYSGVTPELVQSYSASDADADTYTEADTPPAPAFSSLRDTYQSQVRILAGVPNEITSFKYMAEKGITPDDLIEAIHFFRKKNLSIREPEQLEKSALFAMNKRLERVPKKQAEIQWSMEEYINQLCAEAQNG